jgi:hypothetical protein
MKSEQQIWQSWASSFDRLGITDGVAEILEICAPLAVIGSQVIYISQPLLNSIFPAGQLDTLAHLLEDKKRIQSFVTYLHGEEIT